MEREEREQKERERREQKAYEKEQRRIAKEQDRIESKAIEKAGKLQWIISIPQEQGVVVEEPLEIQLGAKKKSYAAADVVDMQSWAHLEVYLREQFEVPESVKRIKLKIIVELDGEPRVRSNAGDQSTLANVHQSIIDLGKLLLDAESIKVNASLVSADIGKKLKAVSKARTRAQEAAVAKFNDLKASIYGVVNHGTGALLLPRRNSYTTGEWKVASTDIMRGEHDYMTKYMQMRDVTETVMGCADYHSNPCVLICPFASRKCKKMHRQLNGVSAISQLYSHWQEVHKDNPAAQKLEARWRLALDNTDKSQPWLDAREPLILSNDEMDLLGGEERGYEKVRSPTEDKTDFKPSFKMHTQEHREWLSAVGTI